MCRIRESWQALAGCVGLAKQDGPDVFPAFVLGPLSFDMSFGIHPFPMPHLCPSDGGVARLDKKPKKDSTLDH